MYKVMLRDNIKSVAKDILESTGKIEVTIDNKKENNRPEILSKIIKNFDGVGIRSGTKITSEVLKNALKLKVVARAGVGVDNINIDECTKKKILVMNAPGGNAVTTAEHAIALMMSLARNIPKGTYTLKNGNWAKKELIGVEQQNTRNNRIGKSRQNCS